MKKFDAAAIVLAAVFILWPLSVVPLQDALNGFVQSKPHQDSGNNVTDFYEIWTSVLAILNIGIIGFQAFIFYEQRKLMEGQLKATQTAADAALAALDRPWLVMEIVGHNELDWMQGSEPLIIEFQIANYGKAPAFVKRMRLLHFRDFNPNMGDRPSDFPAEFVQFPEPDRFFHLLNTMGRTPFIRGDAKIPKMNWPFAHIPAEFVLGGGDKTEVFCLVGYRQRDGESKSIDPVQLTKSYFAGSIFHEFPGQRAEILTFCYHKDDYAKHFGLFRDYPPYNARSEAKAGQ